MKKLIGLSLRQCCQDVATGKVDPSQVKKIISRTSIRKPEHMEEVIADYQLWDWGVKDEPEHFVGGITVHSLFPDQGPESVSIQERAAAFFRQMFAEGKVEQPRLTEGRCPDLQAIGTHWITNKKQIKWVECVASPER